MLERLEGTWGESDGQNGQVGSYLLPRKTLRPREGLQGLAETPGCDVSRLCPRASPAAPRISTKSIQAPKHLGLDPRGCSWDTRGSSADPEPSERRCKKNSQSLEAKEEKGGSPKAKQPPRPSNLGISAKYKEIPNTPYHQWTLSSLSFHSLGS